MDFFSFLFFFGVIPAAAPPITANVHFGDKGPYRFLVDTGAESTMLEPALAATLGLRPAFRTEVVTVLGSSFVPGTKVGGMRIEDAAVGEIEVLFADPVEARRGVPEVRGVLGANALRGFDVLLSAKTRTVSIGARRPAGGAAIPYQDADGRVVVKATMGSEVLSFVLDSGASHIVLFKTPAAMAKTRPVASAVTTFDGARRVAATSWTAELIFDKALRLGTKPAAVVERPGSPADGLLPVAMFGSVFVDRARREVVLVP